MDYSIYLFWPIVFTILVLRFSWEWRGNKKEERHTRLRRANWRTGRCGEDRWYSRFRKWLENDPGNITTKTNSQILDTFGVKWHILCDFFYEVRFLQSSLSYTSMESTIPIVSGKNILTLDGCGWQWYICINYPAHSTELSAWGLTFLGLWLSPNTTMTNYDQMDATRRCQSDSLRWSL